MQPANGDIGRFENNEAPTRPEYTQGLAKNCLAVADLQAKRDRIEVDALRCDGRHCVCIEFAQLDALGHGCQSSLGDCQHLRADVRHHDATRRIAWLPSEYAQNNVTRSGRGVEQVVPWLSGHKLCNSALPMTVYPEAEQIAKEVVSRCYPAENIIGRCGELGCVQI